MKAGIATSYCLLCPAHFGDPYLRSEVRVLTVKRLSPDDFRLTASLGRKDCGPRYVCSEVIWGPTDLTLWPQSANGASAFAAVLESRAHARFSWGNNESDRGAHSATTWKVRVCESPAGAEDQPSFADRSSGVFEEVRWAIRLREKMDSKWKCRQIRRTKGRRTLGEREVLETRTARHFPSSEETNGLGVVPGDSPSSSIDSSFFSIWVSVCGGWEDEVLVPRKDPTPASWLPRWRLRASGCREEGGEECIRQRRMRLSRAHSLSPWVAQHISFPGLSLTGQLKGWPRCPVPGSHIQISVHADGGRWEHDMWICLYFCATDDHSLVN